MEEQTLYWSAEENPYIYKSTKRYYGQPFYVDTGFYHRNLGRRASFDDSAHLRAFKVADVANSGRQSTSTQT
jgi:hypothetical protein